MDPSLGGHSTQRAEDTKSFSTKSGTVVNTLSYSSNLQILNTSVSGLMKNTTRNSSVLKLVSRFVHSTDVSFRPPHNKNPAMKFASEHSSSYELLNKGSNKESKEEPGSRPFLNKESNKEQSPSSKKPILFYDRNKLSALHQSLNKESSKETESRSSLNKDPMLDYYIPFQVLDKESQKEKEPHSLDTREDRGQKYPGPIFVSGQQDHSKRTVLFGQNQSGDRSRDGQLERDADHKKVEECIFPDELFFLQVNHTFNRSEADRLVQRFQLDWNRTLALAHPRDLWNITDHWATLRDLYPQHAPEMGAVLTAMSSWSIQAVTKGRGGSGVKLYFYLTGGQKVVFKPKWYPRDHVWDGRLCDMKDTHNGEIAAFHLSRILGVRKTPLAVGRTVNLRREVRPLATVRARRVLDTTRWRKDKQGRTEGAIILWTPDHVTFEQSEHPWGGVCEAMAEGFRYNLPGARDPEGICRAAQQWDPFREDPALFLDLVDAAIVQYVLLNADRKMYLGTGRYRGFFPVLDNARSFGDPDFDAEEILAPLIDCCRVRESTYLRLQLLQNGTLSYVLDAVTRGDPIYPLLSTRNMHALDRRVHQVLAHIGVCVCKLGACRVLVNL